MPDDPPPDWWQATGLGFGMSPELVRFAAALSRLGGPDAKKHSLAARLAGLNIDRTQAFRHARSVAVRRLLDEAEKIKIGKRPRVTEEEIDARIDSLIRTPDPRIAAQGIELRDRRKEQQRRRGEAPEDDGFSEWRMARDFITLPSSGASAFILLVDSIGGLPLLHDVHAKLMQEEGGPELWQRFYARLNESGRAWLDKHLGDGGYQLDARKQLWAEIGMQPPAGINSNAIDTTKRDDPAPMSSGNGLGETYAT